ncbi:hypothetical protein GW626_18685 [Peribacillus muralis]|uniref:hypothetical protein n=1 Tax=Peribacillus muralis TaxID=264697 RepID=UPI001F4D61B9|nr:hypothetical protein [Peribacillus muralis]MCK1995137.1 hypothetical protein [Peribacillus muralis]MCK2015780.1 hypothetical protein [Peribacillus muralis]
MGTFQVLYLIGIVAGVIIYLLLKKNVIVKKGDFKRNLALRTLLMFYIGLGIIGVSMLYGFTGMAIAVSGLGVMTIAIVMLFIEIYKRKSNKLDRKLN